MSDLNRRKFLVSATLTVAGMAACGCGARRALGADSDEEEDEDIPTGPFDAGALSDYLLAGVVDRFAKKEKIFLVTEGNRLFAPTAICTHRYCTIKVQGDHYKCPCHGSRFSREGKRLSGRARRSLPHLGIKVNEHGHVIVDRSKTFEEKNWGDAGSFVTLKS